MEQLNNGPLETDLANTALRQTVELDNTAPGTGEQCETTANRAADTIPQPSPDTDSVPGDNEAAPDRPNPHNETGQSILANVYSDPKRHTVALLLDEVTANMVIYAVRVLAADSEAHARETRLVGATMPPDSYGAANRHAIASRHERIALRLRALENSYHDEVTTPRESLRHVRR